MRRIGLASILLLSACVSASDVLMDSPCPCAGGQVCCPTTNTCRYEAECPDFADTDLAIDSVSPNHAALGGGQRIVVRGAGFHDDVEVTIGGRACRDLDVQSEARLSCVVPPGSPYRSAVALVVADDPFSARSDLFRYDLPPFTDMTPVAGLGEPTWGSGVHLFDMNGDGRLDVFFGAGHSSIRGPLLYENLGGFRFEDATTAELDAAVVYSSSMVAADFTNDGLEDVFVGNQRAFPRATLLMRREGPGFRFGEQIVPVNPPRAAVGVSAADLDADGWIDVVACRDPNDGDNGRRLTTARLFVGRNDGGVIRDDPGGYVHPTEAPSIYCRALALGDVDGDGDPDAVGCGEELTLFVNEGGVFTDGTAAAGIDPQVPFEDSFNYCRAIDLVDVDSDGDLDLAYVLTGSVQRRRPGGTIIWENRWLEGQGARFEPFPPAEATGALCAAHELAPGATLFAGAKSVVWLDRDMDGDLDVAVPQPSTQCATTGWWLDNDSTGRTLRFDAGSLETLGVAGSVTGGVAGDLDGDGDPDLVFHEWGPGGRALVRNNAAENQELGRYLVVRPISDPDGDATDADRTDDRVQPGVTVELDMDGPEPPDFARGYGRLQIRTLGGGGTRSHGPVEARFGLGDRVEPVWLRARFPDGSTTVVRVESFDRVVELVDCGGPSCD